MKRKSRGTNGNVEVKFHSKQQMLKRRTLHFVSSRLYAHYPFGRNTTHGRDWRRDSDGLQLEYMCMYHSASSCAWISRMDLIPAFIYEKNSVQHEPTGHDLARQNVKS